MTIVIKAIDYSYSFISNRESFLSLDGYVFPPCPSNRTYMVQQVIGIPCVMLECQEHPFFLYKTAILFDTLVFICSLHVKFSSMITSRNFVCDTCSISVPFKVMFTVGVCCLLFVDMIPLVLFTLSDNLLTLNHISSFFLFRY